MLASVGKLFSNVRSYYNEINSATLTGAIDVVVVEQPDGTYQSSPFHVRFGKLGVMRANEKVVYIEINGQPIDLQMKLGPAGEAFFVQESEKWEGPSYLATSPIGSLHNPEPVLHPSISDSALKRHRNESEQSVASTSSSSEINLEKKEPPKFHFEPISQIDDEILESGGMFQLEVDEAESTAGLPDVASSMSKCVSLPVAEENRLTMTQSWALNSCSSFHPFSDTDLTPNASPTSSRPQSPKSDTECEYATTERKREDSEKLQNWTWGELPESSIKEGEIKEVKPSPPKADKQPASTDAIAEPSGLWAFMKSTKTLRHKPQEGGIYLDDINLQEMDPEVASLYFPKKENQLVSQVVSVKEEDTESGKGTSLPHSPPPEEKQLNIRSTLTPSSDTGTMKDHDFGIFGDIAMSLCGGLQDVQNPTEELFSKHLLTYAEFSTKPVESLQNPSLVVRISGKYYNWATAAPMLMSMIVFQQTLPHETQDGLIKSHMPTKKQKGRSSWWPWGRGKEPDALTDAPALSSNPSSPNGSPKKTSVLTNMPQNLTTVQTVNEVDYDADNEKEKTEKKAIPEPKAEQITKPLVKVLQPEHYVKTLRLTSDQLGKLNLHEGQNSIEFSVTTAYQGTTRCEANIYLWKHTDKIIISDIDGTITKSDIMGQLLPMVGKDWSHSGVTELFTKISGNGYKFAYLSARAIGQAQITRDYLKSVKQGQSCLPPGPLLLNPSSLLNAFHKEVIEKKPEEFKIKCMRDIQSLFTSKCALYAGFGNRINDMFAYRTVGIPKSRMFLIDPTGKLKSDLLHTFQSSYSRLSDDVDHYFPPIDAFGAEVIHHSPAEYSNFTYWRDPIPEICVIEDFP